jgi:hypothetical protein
MLGEQLHQLLAVNERDGRGPGSKAAFSVPDEKRLVVIMVPRTAWERCRQPRSGSRPCAG